jgi:hypothetical protein
VLFLHEVHAAIGEREIDLDEAIRDVYAPAIADDDTRLLWYLYSTHGAGDAYFSIAVTALRDGAAWERLSRRQRYGDLADWCVALDAMTYSSHSTLMVGTEWSPTADLDLDAVPVSGVEHPVEVFREDTIEGDGIEDAVSEPSAVAAGNATLSCIAGFRPALSTGGSVTVLYRVAGKAALESALDTDVGWGDWSGSLTQNLPADAHGSSRLLRNVPWSPLA